MGFFIMHYVAGVILSIVFQLAHVIEAADSTKNRIMNWFTGGLNHQVEHHIFPNISHVHYTKISKIVRETAQEFNLPYNEYKTTRKAIIAHFRHLKHMGQQPALHA